MFLETCLYPPIWDLLYTFDGEFTDQTEQLDQTHGIPAWRSCHGTILAHEHFRERTGRSQMSKSHSQHVRLDKSAVLTQQHLTPAKLPLVE